MKSILSYLGLSLFSLNIAHSQEMNLRDETLNIDESEIRSLERSHLEIGNNLKNIYNRARLYDSALDEDGRGGRRFFERVSKITLREWGENHPIFKNAEDIFEERIKKFFSYGVNKVRLSLGEVNDLEDSALVENMDRYNLKFNLDLNPNVNVKIGNVLTLGIYSMKAKAIVGKHLGNIDLVTGIQTDYLRGGFESFVGIYFPIKRGFIQINANSRTNKYSGQELVAGVFGRLDF
ncbi:hypothetical protein COU54_05360 [Candidatus Pacearchaeota archaeon CG10_big_fil_rev_8_21_14_0_10_31_24]|nr:MAG: hypothetical protein COU54_05360 [Candidatus Pacearchaeota archaeon CG10_big_fil_rev_8_21_14_0_10_31_24]